MTKKLLLGLPAALFVLFLLAAGAFGSGAFSTGGTGSLPIVYMHTAADWYEEFDGPDSGVVFDHLSCAASGGSCTCAGNSTRPGLCTLSTASSATGHARMSGNRAAYSFSDTDVATVEFLGVSLPVLDPGSSGENYDVVCGWGDATNVTEPADGAYFLYHATTGGGAGGTNSPKWQIGTASNSVRLRATLDGSTTDTVDRTVTAGDDSVNPETGLVYNLKVSCISARCDFYMQRVGTDLQYVRVGSACAGGTCSMLATSIPPAGTARVFAPQCMITKWAGTTARVMNLDAAGVHRPFLVAR